MTPKSAGMFLDSHIYPRIMNPVALKQPVINVNIVFYNAAFYLCYILSSVGSLGGFEDPCWQLLKLLPPSSSSCCDLF